MNKSFLLIFILCGITVGLAQPLSTKNKKAIDLYIEADNFRVRGQFDQAIKLLKQAIDKDKKFEEAYYRLATTYRNSGDIKSSSESFEKALELTPYPLKQKVYNFSLGDNYIRQGLYEKAKTNLEKFLTIEKTDKAKIDQVLLWKSQAEYGLAHQGENAGYKIKALNDTVNKYPMQYFPCITADGLNLIFTVRYGHAHNDNEDIFISKKDDRGRWKAPVPLSENINSDYREGASSISADGRHLIFTICGPRGCDLYESEKEGDVWKKPKNLGSAVNSSGWEAQPSLSADGNELYFVSDRKGGIGGYDIWYSKKDSTGSWTKAVNVGKPVNTKFDEMAPYIHVNNKNLYFASNGMPGFGGFDIYSSEKSNGQWLSPENLGAPLNDYEDQYSFAVSSDGSRAYYSREEGGNHSKIYQTEIPKNLQVRSRGNVVQGVVINSQTKAALQAQVELFDLKTGERISVVTSDSINGRYLVVVPGKSEYAFHVSEPGYLFFSQHFNYEEKDLDHPLVIDIALQPITKNAVTVLNNIFFEFNKSDINQRSYPELDEVAKFLKENPKIKVEISGHTDNVGVENYNQQLSLKRAQSVVNYFLSKGIAVTQLTQIGYGSKKPIKPNDTEENRQVNRRIEFKILE